MNIIDLRHEVNDIITAEIQAGKSELIKSALVLLILGRYPPAEGPGTDFFTVAAHYAIDDLVSRRIRVVGQSEREETSQLVLPGYERLQSAYLVSRKEPTIVPIHLMSVAEGRAKAAELRAMAKGLEAHAVELDLYFDKREQASAAE